MKSLEKIKQKLIKKPLHAFVGFIILIVIIAGSLFIYRLIKPEKISKVAYPFTSLEYQILTKTPKKWQYKNLRQDLKNIPTKLNSYQTQVKPLMGLQDKKRLDNLIKTLGFTDKAENYTNSNTISWIERGKALNIDFIGSSINFSVGLNVESELLDSRKSLSEQDIIQTTNFFLTENKLNPDYSLSSTPKVVYSKMEAFGLVETTNQQSAEAVTLVFSPIIDNIMTEQSDLSPSFTLLRNGTMVAFSLTNKKLSSQQEVPLKTYSEIKKAIENNQAITLNKINSSFLSPDTAILDKLSLLYFFNEKTSYLSPVYKLEMTFKKDSTEQTVVFYLPAFKDKYYNR